MEMITTLIVIGGLGGGLIAAAYLIAYLSLRARKPRLLQSNPAQKGLAYEDVAFDSLDGVPLKGWYIPSKSHPESETTLVLTHGFGADRTVFLDVLPALSEAGYHLFLYDLRTCGESGGRWC